VARCAAPPGGRPQLLDEAGWRERQRRGGTRDKDGREFAFDLLVSSGCCDRLIRRIHAEQQRKPGSVRVRSLEWAAYVDRLDRGVTEAASGA
jgi:hypothetical protein